MSKGRITREFLYISVGPHHVGVFEHSFSCAILTHDGRSDFGSVSFAATKHICAKTFCTYFDYLIVFLSETMKLSHIYT